MNLSRRSLLVFSLLVFSIVARAHSRGAAHVIAGIVVDEHSGQPLANTTVSIAPVGTPDNSRSATTGPDGRFRFNAVPQGKYSLVGKRRGYSAQSYDQHEQFATAIAVADDQDTSKLVFRLRPDASIRGRITDENSEPVPQMQVWLFSTRNDLGRRSTRITQQTATNDLGEYSFGHLEPGTYYLLATGKPWYADGRYRRMQERNRARDRQDGRTETPEHESVISQEDEAFDKTYPLTFYDDVQDSTQASAIDLAAGDRFTADFHVTAVQAATIRLASDVPRDGERQMHGQNMPRLQLTAKAFGDQFVTVPLNYTSRGDGTAEVGGIPPGRYLAEVRYPGDSRSYSQEIDVAGDMDLPRLTSTTGAVVRGKFVWDGPPVRHNVGVMLTSSRTNRNYYCIPRPNDDFEVAESVEPGTYELTANSQSETVYVKSVQVDGKPSSSIVKIADGGDVNLTITLAQGTGTINGVALLDGKPQSGVMVVLVPSNGWAGVGRFRRDQSDSDGTFTLRNVVPGKYGVVALKNGWNLPWSDPNVMRGFVAEGTPVDIAASGSVHVEVQVK